MSVEAKAIVRHFSRVGDRFPLKMTWSRFVTFVTVEAVVVLWTLMHAEPSMFLLCLLATGINCVIFVVPVPGPKDARKAQEHVIDVVPRFVRLVGRIVEGAVDVHAREVEGRHYSDRTLPTDIPFSTHLGDQLWLSSFDWLGRSIGLVIRGGTRLRPWRASQSICIKVAAADSILLESESHQEHLLNLWETTLDGLFKENLGLTGLQVLISSRPLLPGEDAHWVSNPTDDRLQTVRYRAVQAAHDEVAIERCEWLVFRSGGTFKSWFTARHKGSSRAGFEQFWRSVLDNVWSVIPQAKLKIVEVLGSAALADRLRVMVDPSSAPAVGYSIAGKAAPSRVTHVAPISEWDDRHSTYLKLNGWFFQTFRVVGWPASRTGAQFLYTQIMNHPGGLLFTEIIEPEDPTLAKYSTKAGLTNAHSKRKRREAKDTITTEADKIVEAQAGWRDVELAAGHQGVQLVAYLTTYNRTEEAMERAGDDLAIKCRAIGVTIAPCSAFQGEALCYVLPYCWTSC